MKHVSQRLTFVFAVLMTSQWGALSVAQERDGVVIKGPKGSEVENVRVGEKRYGPIDSDDTLWNIATTHRPHSSVSVEQMMAAIVQANPRAFVDGNMNRMLDGFYLRIPSLQEIQMVNPVAAERQQQLDLSLLEKQQQQRQQEQQLELTRAQQEELLLNAQSEAERAIESVRNEEREEFEAIRQAM